MNDIDNMNASYDVLAKRLLSRKIILARILKHTVSEFSNVPEIDIANNCIESEPSVNLIPLNDSLNIRGRRSDDNSPSEGLVSFDIKFDAVAPADGSTIRLIINVEAQRAYHTGYPILKRAIYYAARLISSQKETEFHGSDYGNIKKVYTIWLCMDVPLYLADSIQRYQLTKEDLHGQASVKSSDYDLVNIVMLNLGNAPMTHELLALLHLLFLDLKTGAEKERILNERFALQLSSDAKEDLEEMGSGLMQPAIDFAVRKAVREARQQERVEAQRDERIHSIRTLMQTMKWTAQEAMDALKIPASEQHEFLTLL